MKNAAIIALCLIFAFLPTISAFAVDCYINFATTVSHASYIHDSECQGINNNAMCRYESDAKYNQALNAASSQYSACCCSSNLSCC